MPLDAERPYDQAPATVGVSVHDAPEPSFMETLGAAFRQENLIGSALTYASDYTQDQLRRVDRNYNVFDDLEGYEQYADSFETVYNREAAQAVKARIDQEKSDRDTLAASGWTGVGLSMGAAMLDPTILLPGGALVKAGRIGYSGVRSAAAVGGAAAVATTVQEAGLQATQELRTGTESAINIGGSAILGGLIGAGASRFFSRAEWSRASRAIEDDLAGEVPNPREVTETIVQRMRSAGAASVDEIPLDDLGIGGGRAVQIVANATAAARINPGIQTMMSPSRSVREVYARMVDNPVYSNMNMDGRTLGPDVENLVKQYQRGALAKWITSSRSLYKEAKANGYRGTIREFNEAVARAGRRGDVDPGGNEQITKAAQEARSMVFDPLLQRAKAAGLLPEDVKVSTSASYVTRLWNRQRLIGEEDRFREIARRYFSQEMDRAIIRQEETQLGNKVVDTMFVEDRFNRAFDRLQSVEARLAKRQAARDAKLSRMTNLERRRFDVLRGRAPRPVVDALREGKEGDTLVNFANETRRAQKDDGAKRPVLGILKSRGGVRIGSTLDGELRAMGVTPKTAPGLFKNGSGRGAADNIVAEEYEIFQSLAVDDNGYVLQDEILEAIRQEMAGAPLRSPDQQGEMSIASAMDENLTEWLDSVGLEPDATIGQIRQRMNEVLGQERALDDVDMQIARIRQEIEEFDTATDAVRNERIISEAEAKNIADELATLEEAINANADLARSSPAVARIVDYAKARREFGKARYDQTRINGRLDALKRVDAEGRLTPELEAEMVKLARDAEEIQARVDKASARSNKLRGMLPKQKKELPEFIDASDRDDYIEQIITSVFNNLTGKGKGDVPEWLVPVTRGPLKDRTFNIPDEMIEDFLENDMELIMRRYTRTMAAEVELADKFGRADMKDQFDEITREYEELRANATTPAERERLNLLEKRDVDNLAAFRDMIRGTYRASEEGSVWSKITRAALTWNYIRLLGGVTLTSLADTARIIGVHGVRATMREALPALTRGLKAAKISVQDGRDLGAITERVLQSRLASLADLQDPYAYGSKFERMLSNASNGFSKLTLLGWWNDTMKTVASVMTQNRMMRNALDWQGAGKIEQNYMAYLGIDEDMASRIAGQFRKHGMQEEGIYGANVADWDDELAARTWGAALNKDVDRTIITKGVADTPLWMKTNWGKLIFQFKSFMLASHQRILIAGLQERPHRFAEQMLMGTTMGMMIAYLKMVERGDTDEADALVNNPGRWVADGLDRSGIFSIIFDATNTADKVVSSYGGPNIGINRLFSEIAGDENSAGGSTRYASRNATGAVGGPSLGIFEDLANIAASIGKQDFTKGSVNAMIRQIPGATLPGFRTAIHVGIKPELQDAVQ